MLWLAANAGVDRKLLVAAACLCAETALTFVPAGEERPARAIATARAWVRGEASISEVRNAVDAAYAAHAAAAHAAHAAAADAAYAAAAAAATATAAYAAATATATATAAYATRKEALADCATLVRSVISAEQVETALGGI